MPFRTLALASLLAGLPAVASAEPLNIGVIFAHASVTQKVIMTVLFAAMFAAVTVTARKLASGKPLAGGSAFVAGLRLGGPIIGALGAAYMGVEMSIGMANVAVAPTLKVLAPGFAEATLIIWLGCLTGAVAAIAHWAIEARIDRQVLGA